MMNDITQFLQNGEHELCYHQGFLPTDKYHMYREHILQLDDLRSLAEQGYFHQFQKRNGFLNYSYYVRRAK